MWVWLILAGIIAGMGITILWLARANGRLKKERDSARATAKLKDVQVEIAVDARPGDGGRGLHGGSF